MGLLDGKVALVTGAGAGLGAATARLFAEEGARVVVSDIDTEAGEQVAADIGDAAVFVPLDVASDEAWGEAVQATEDVFGPIDVLVNNAGIADMQPLDVFDEERYLHTFRINQLSVFHSLKHVPASMQRAGGGAIVNISSIEGVKGSMHAIAYSSTKFALRGMTRSAAHELAASNIRVNSVHPGGMNTELVAQVRTTQPGVIEQFEEQIPMQRMADPVEVARTVLFFASDLSSYCTGSELVVDGGSTA